MEVLVSGVVGSDAGVVGSVVEDWRESYMYSCT